MARDMLRAVSAVDRSWRWAPVITVVALLAVEMTEGRPLRASSATPVTLSPVAQRIVERSLGELGAVRKWTTPVRIHLHGSFDAGAREHAKALLASWRGAAPGLDIALASKDEGNVNIYLLKRADFSGYDSRASGQLVLSRLWADGGHIRRARILIGDELDDRKRREALRVELLRCLGIDSQGAPAKVIHEVLGYWYQPALAAGSRRDQL